MQAYFATKDKSIYKKGMERIEKRSRDCIALKRNYGEEVSRIVLKNCCSIGYPTDFSVGVLYNVQAQLQRSLVLKQCSFFGTDE